MRRREENGITLEYDCLDVKARFCEAYDKAIRQYRKRHGEATYDRQVEIAGRVLRQIRRRRR